MDKMRRIVIAKFPVEGQMMTAALEFHHYLDYLANRMPVGCSASYERGVDRRAEEDLTDYLSTSPCNQETRV